MIKKSVGVIVGRFQVSELTKGHKELIEYVISENDTVLIFLGVAPTKLERNNPLNFKLRKNMIEVAFPTVHIKPLKDIGHLDYWNQALDDELGIYSNYDSEVTLYGSRDSMVSRYDGNHNVEYVDAKTNVSGTKSRMKDWKYDPDLETSSEFRKGVIYASNEKYPQGYPTVDIICIDEDMILLGKKPFRDKYCLIGGFFDPEKDNSFEDAAVREFEEETTLKVKDPWYLMSTKVNDWRYKNEVNKIITSVHVVTYDGGVWNPEDDIAELKWFNIRQLIKDNDLDNFLETKVINHHRNIIKQFAKFYEQNHM